MGYCIDMRAASFRVPADNFTAARDAIVKLMERGAKEGRGFSSGGNHFSWMNDHGITAETSFEDAMKAWRYPVFLDDEGNVNDIQFWGEKLGQEDLLFEVIAPFVTPGSHIEMHGEDGTIWRWQFDGKTCKEVTAKVTFGDDEDDEPDTVEYPADGFIPLPKVCKHCGGEVPLLDAECKGCAGRTFTREGGWHHGDPTQ